MNLPATPSKSLTVMVHFPDGDRAIPSHMAETQGSSFPGSRDVVMRMVNTPDPLEGWLFKRVLHASAGTPDWQAIPDEDRPRENQNWIGE